MVFLHRFRRLLRFVILVWSVFFFSLVVVTADSDDQCTIDEKKTSTQQQDVVRTEWYNDRHCYDSSQRLVDNAFIGVMAESTDDLLHSSIELEQDGGTIKKQEEDEEQEMEYNKQNIIEPPHYRRPEQNTATTTTTAMQSNIRPKGRVRNWIKRVQSFLPRIWHKSRTIEAHDTSDQQEFLLIDTTEDKEEEANNKKKKNIKRKTIPFEAFQFRNKIDMEETMAGARLLSGSFSLVASTAGVLATTVRISGDTAAGIMGSSVKVLGTAVKSVGSGLTGISSRLQDGNHYNVAINKAVEYVDIDGSCRSPAASCHQSQWQDHQRPTEPSSQEKSSLSLSLSLPTLSSWRQKQKKRYGRVRNISRKIALKSVQVVGSAMGGVGESLLIAGAAAEALVSSTAGVAEETVRIVEDLASTLSVAISLRGEQQRKRRARKKELLLTPSSQPKWKSKFTPKYISFGSYETISGEDTFSRQEKLRFRLMNEPSVEDARELIALLIMDTIGFGRDIAADVEGVPSMAGELFTALIFCYLMAVLLLSPSRREREEVKATSNETVVANDKKAHRPARALVSLSKKSFLCLVVLPFRVVGRMLWFFFAVFFNRKMLLFGVYCLVWTYISRLSKNKALQIQMRSEAMGFRNGIATMTDNSQSGEAFVQINQLLRRFWRINSHGNDGKSSIRRKYPMFVSRVFLEDSGESYGGLEPFISSAIGAGLIKNLELAKATRPTDVAYVSLFSLSLGGQPPVIRKLEIVQGDSNRLELDLDLEAFLNDMAMILEVKLSSLSYALLPSTKIKIHSLDFRASLRVVLELAPDYPFVSKIEISLATQPFCNLRLTPVSKDSGLNGIDLGSIPFLNDWIKDSIRFGLAAYVTPRYVSIDLAALLHGDKPTIGSVGPVDIMNLRRQTRFAISQLRTSSPGGIATTSVADQLEAHQASSQALGSLEPNDIKRRAKSVLRPVTELSRLALDRNALKKDNRIRPITELARLGMDRWLDAELSTANKLKCK